MRHNKIVTWICRIVAAAIMLQTLYFKFTGADESIFIFSQVGMEPWGRYAAGIAELIASVLILLPRTSVLGALLALGIMAGALATHLFVIGIEVANDGGLLFIYACLVMLASGYIVYDQREVLLTVIHKRRLTL
ncbi:MAG: DoxX family protein [Sphingobacteriales bacterium]|nr:MAG: DoxX family protein [Sphingobacteriales bacterium]